MEAEQEIQEDLSHEEEAGQENLQPEKQVEQEEYIAAEEAPEHHGEQKNLKNLKLNDQGEDRSGFIHGLAVGLGIGCITTFVIMWIAVFFTPLLPPAVTYETLLSIFIYPLIYLLAVGLIALTAGVVREYYARRS
jgi:fructose-specific phosphotransferase system IIC component